MAIEPARVLNLLLFARITQSDCPGQPRCQLDGGLAEDGAARGVDARIELYLGSRRILIDPHALMVGFIEYEDAADPGDLPEMSGYR